MEYTTTQTRRLVSYYGGVGSVIETPRGSLKIDPFDQWPFYREIIRKVDPKEFALEDHRLLKRLQTQNGFPKLRELIQVPPNTKHPRIKKLAPRESDEVVSASYFPRWWHCNNCKKLKPISEWWNRWKEVREKYRESEDRDKFIPPKCAYCFDKAQSENRKKRYYSLEQVRFIMTAENGEIRDIPWERWNKAKTYTQKEDDKSRIEIDWSRLCCENQDLRYRTSTKFSDMVGIRIECNSCKAKKNLSGLFGLRVPVSAGEEVYYKPVLRTSSSCYYPILLNSLYLPTEREISHEDQNAIKEWHAEGEDVDFMFKALRRNYTKEAIAKFIEVEIKNEFESETAYRLKEYQFLTKPERTHYPEDPDDNRPDLIFQRESDMDELHRRGVACLIAVRRLKITTVQTGYTRQEPMDNDRWFLGNEEHEVSRIKPKYTSKYENNTWYLPAVESFGEGIFISLDKGKIEEWIRKVFDPSEDFKSRIISLYHNAKKIEITSIKGKFEDEKHLARFVLVHTLSHLFIKELEFNCGYSAASLNERLFVDEASNMSGVLLYTVAGAEGSYGGLVSHATAEGFSRLLQTALERARDCASDPICRDAKEGQGIGGLNMAACYSCALIPENACEEFNGFLDRLLLIDERFGFFNSVYQ